MRLATLSADRPIVEDNGTMSQQMRRFMSIVARFSIIEGEGSPEGTIEARATRLYLDITGSAGAVLYIKQLESVGGDKSKGWILV